MKLKELGEFGFIKKISKEFLYDDPKIIRGIGDDAGVTKIDNEKYLLTTTDVLIEDIHFSLTYVPPFILGRKSVAVSLSDIAAMGGVPKYLLLSLSIPPEEEEIDLEFLIHFYKGVKEITESYGVKLIGGNTSSSGKGLIIGVTMLGEGSMDKVVFRSGAKVGDRIFVTGTLGDSALGLKYLKIKDSTPLADTTYKDTILLHIDPVPRVEEGKRIAERGLATSMIDISDGLLADLRHIMEESNVGAKVSFQDIPLSPALKSHLKDSPEDMNLPLAGGEDYELLFTADPSQEENINCLSRELKCPITSIGEILPKEEGLLLKDGQGNLIDIKEEGFNHFRPFSIRY